MSQPAKTTSNKPSQAAFELRVGLVLLCLSLLPVYGLEPVLAAKKKTSPQLAAKPTLKPLTPKTATPAQPEAPSRTAEQPADEFPLVGQLEKITFGFSKPQQPIKDRLMVLEAAVFHQSFPHKSTAQRTQALSDTLLGPSTQPDNPPVRLDRSFISPPPVPETQLSKPETTSLFDSSEYQTEYPFAELKTFALEQINQQRGQQGLPPLAWDATADKVAKEHVEELLKRKAVSHLSLQGDNPDLRYTKAGGTDALSESLVTLNGTVFGKNNKSTVASVIQALNGHQDDRDALLSPDATHFGFSFGYSPERQKLLACAEVVTKHGIMHPLPEKITVGQKIEVKGVLLEPYRFQRVTLAWEGNHSQASEGDEESSDVLPYFPPLDFVAYGQKSQRDHQKAMTILKTAGVIAAIAGGMFMPPVALAAPLIAMSGGIDEPHPVSEIPVKGGIKVEGAMFHGNVPVDNEGKEGMYYVTVWAASALDGHPVPVSRRIVIATSGNGSSKESDNKPQDISKSTESGTSLQ